MVDQAKTRKRLAEKLQTPRLLQIHLHTFRHWKGTMLYHPTRDTIYVKEFLGHCKLDSTMTYIRLINFESDEYHSATAKTIDEAKALIEAGFEYVATYENVMLFRKRK